MNLSEIVLRSGISAPISRDDAYVTSMVMDSRQVKPDALFVAMPGMSRDTHPFLAAAKDAGAGAAIVHSNEGRDFAESLGMAWVQLSSHADTFADQIWRVCDVFFDHPTRYMKVIGVTGTNGKTTTAWLIRDILVLCGMRPAYLGTLGFQLPDSDRVLENTTPFVVDLYNYLSEAREQSVQAMAIEVSSHALAQRRVDGVEFDAAVFTNLTQDHLDFHGSMEAYEAAKWRLFSDLPTQSSKSRFRSVVNLDDPVGEKWLASGLPNASAYSMKFDSAVPALRLFPNAIRVDSMNLSPAKWSAEKSEFIADGARQVRVPLGGSYNHANITAAFAGALAFGLTEEQIWSVLPKVRPVPGRFEAVPNNNGFGVIVDYAHTPDALEKLLDAVRPLTQGRIITVFGCGGDRDRTKRPKMARSASLRSDLTIATSDNPRTEDPDAILAEVITGIVPGKQSVSIVDRREAVAYAIKSALPGDVVVLAGKGHENYQIIGRTKLPMDDRALAREALVREEMAREALARQELGAEDSA